MWGTVLLIVAGLAGVIFSQYFQLGWLAVGLSLLVALYGVSLPYVHQVRHLATGARRPQRNFCTPVNTRAAPPAAPVGFAVTRASQPTHQCNAREGQAYNPARRAHSRTPNCLVYRRSVGFLERVLAWCRAVWPESMSQ